MKRKWFTNGQVDVLRETCPDGFWPGRKPVSEETRQKHSKNNGSRKLTPEQKQAKAQKISATKQARTEEDIQQEISKAKQTFLAHYGVEHPMQLDSVKEKLRQTNLKVYGVENVAQAAEIQEKMQQTNLEKYGTKNVFAADCIKEKIKQTNIERYGVDNYQKTEEARELARKRYQLNKERILQVCAQVKFARYGDEHYNNTNKAKQTCLERYGVESYSQTELFHKIARRKYCFEDLYFDSLPELAIYLYAVFHNIDIEHNPIKFEYEVNNKTHYYFPDFKYDNRLIEIKGDHFFENGKMINPFDRSQDTLYEAKHQCGLRNNVEFWTSSDYKFALDWFKEIGLDKTTFEVK